MIDGRLRTLFQRHLPLIHWTSIETGLTGRGIPDSNGCLDGKEFWVEFKQAKHWRVGLRPEQIGWLMRRTRVGGRTFIAVRRAGSELWLFNGAEAMNLAAISMDTRRHAALGIWDGGPARWDWEKIQWWLTQ